MDLPEGYSLTGGDGINSFSFESSLGSKFDIVFYQNDVNAGATGRSYSSLEALTQDVQSRLNNSGDIDFFEYRGKKASLLTLEFLLPGSGRMTGWALCFELDSLNRRQTGSGINPGISKPMLLAMAYNPAGRNDLSLIHLSALDSIAPEEGDRLAPGPITEYAYPRENRRRASIFGLGINAWIFEEDAEAAQALIDREFQVLTIYQNAPNWKDAWTRFYKAIYRDSFERLADIAFQVERRLNVPLKDDRIFANMVLNWVQNFEYERNIEGSDFINLITAATEGIGDCDNRAMLWAIVLIRANIPAGIMVSREYGHAMGLADLDGAGARFEVNGIRYLVAETTADVSIGLIGETVSEIEYWHGINFAIRN